MWLLIAERIFPLMPGFEIQSKVTLVLSALTFLCGFGIHPNNGISIFPSIYSITKQNGFTYSTTYKIEKIITIKIGSMYLYTCKCLCFRWHFNKKWSYYGYSYQYKYKYCAVCYIWGCQKINLIQIWTKYY